jgi:hypothetical protein
LLPTGPPWQHIISLQSNDDGNGQTRIGNWERSLFCSILFILERKAMFLQLNHHQFDVYTVARLFVKDCYVLTKSFPQEEKFAMVQQIKRAALSVYLNIAEGFSRKKALL